MGIWEGVGTVLFLDCGGGYGTVCICQNSIELHIKKTGFYCM